LTQSQPNNSFYYVVLDSFLILGQEFINRVLVSSNQTIAK